MRRESIRFVLQILKLSNTTRNVSVVYLKGFVGFSAFHPPPPHSTGGKVKKEVCPT